MSEALEGESDYYLELAVRLRALALEAHFPSARRALMKMAKRFDRRAERYAAEIAIPDKQKQFDPRRVRGVVSKTELQQSA
jgi:hypothetical protein